MKTSIVHFAIRGAVALSLVLGCAAQETNIHRALSATVKPDRVGEFEAAIKELRAVQKKGGRKGVITVWQAATGRNRYVSVQFLSSMAVMGQAPDQELKGVAAELAQIRSRISQCISDSERRISIVDRDLSVPRTDEIPNLIRVMHTRALPGKAADYVALLKEYLKPAIKAAGLKSYGFYRTRLGGSPREFFSAAGIDSWSDLDAPVSPVAKAMGEARSREFTEKLSQVAETLEVNVYRFRRDLSYLPETTATRPSGE